MTFCLEKCLLKKTDPAVVHLRLAKSCPVLSSKLILLVSLGVLFDYDLDFLFLSFPFFPLHLSKSVQVWPAAV